MDSTYTSRADELYKEAESLDFSADPGPFASCYETLLEQQDILKRARVMESAARDIRSCFEEIAKSGLPLPDSSLLRKGVVSVKRGKEMFSCDQLSKVVAMLMDQYPYVLFRPKSDTKYYVILLFWATSVDDTSCDIQKNVDVVKREISVDNFELRFTVENIPAPRRQFLYLLNNYFCVKVQNDAVRHLPPDGNQQLQTFTQLLKEPESSRKRKSNEPIAEI